MKTSRLDALICEETISILKVVGPILASCQARPFLRKEMQHRYIEKLYRVNNRWGSDNNKISNDEE